MLPGETTEGELTRSCTECSAELPLGVCKSPAGYFIGYWCNSCGPAGRETGYFGTDREANDALESYYADGILRLKRT
jgi:hypothetical protein